MSSPDPCRELVAMFERDLRQDVSRLLEHRFTELEAALASRIAGERLAVVRELAQALNQPFARMRRCESDEEWCEELLTAASTLCRRAAFFSIRGDKLWFQGARGLDRQPAAAPRETPLGSAPAFASAARRGIPVEARRTAAELSEDIAALFGDAPDVSVTLLPIVTARVAKGVLYAEGAVEITALETIATVAGAMLEAHAPARAASSPPEPLPSHSDLRALSFARVEVARLLLANSAALRRGRESRNIYGVLKNQIDALRQEYRRRFPGTGDRLHAEFVRTLAQNDPDALGGEYPGPMA
ncbi:MAG TPA: hypothetical protein VFA28_03450 [Bryobacteraceae bacterium]|nr:hypothetical protein [Bryobacteraceae bacterium]